MSATSSTFSTRPDARRRLIAYIEQRWPDLDALERDFPPYAGQGDFMMLEVALAYSRTGNQERFEDAMARMRRVGDDLQAQGVDNPTFFMSEAAYHALAGERRRQSRLARPRGHARVRRPRHRASRREWPALRATGRRPALRSSSRQRMIEHLNAERAELGLDPVEA